MHQGMKTNPFYLDFFCYDSKSSFTKIKPKLLRDPHHFCGSAVFFLIPHAKLISKIGNNFTPKQEKDVFWVYPDVCIELAERQKPV